MERNIFIVGNWKMNKTPEEAKKFFYEFNKMYLQNKEKISKNIKFGVACPSIDLEVIKKESPNNSMLIAAQDFSFENEGAFTGDLSSNMIKSVGANSVIIGHSERREYHKETNEILNKKILKALDSELKPIFCIGETLEQRNSNIWKEVLLKQLEEGLKNLNEKQIINTIIAYEPIWAIGTGVTATSDQAQEACEYVRKIISNLFSLDISNKVIIQYGGSVKPENVEELMSKKDIDGALVGGASLNPSSYLKLLTLNK